MSLKKNDPKGYNDFSDLEIPKEFLDEKLQVTEKMKYDFEIPDDFLDNPKLKRKGLMEFIMGNRLEENLIILAVVGGLTFSIITWIQGKLE